MPRAALKLNEARSFSVLRRGKEIKPCVLLEHKNLQDLLKQQHSGMKSGEARSGLWERAGLCGRAAPRQADTALAAGDPNPVL